MLPAGLSMLWELVDPHLALRDRFGFPGLAAAVDWISASSAHRWGVAVQDCHRLVISADNAIAWVASDRGPLVVKWSRALPRFDRLAASTELLGRLAERGLPVAAPVTSHDGEARVVLDGPAGPLSVAVLPELEGEWLDVGDPVAVRAAGACLAAVHLALVDSTDPRLRQPAEEELPDRRLRRWLADGGPGSGSGPVADARTRLGRLVADLPPLAGGAQLVHGDFRAANILVRDRRVVGVLDFDEVAGGHPVGDLAQASVYLGTRFTDWRPTPGPVRRQLRDGYTSVRPLTPLEGRWLDALTLWQAVLAVPHSHDPALWARALEVTPDPEPPVPAGSSA